MAGHGEAVVRRCSLKFRKIYWKTLEACNFIKKRLWHRCFPVNFVKFLRTPFLQNTSGGCFSTLFRGLQFTSLVPLPGTFTWYLYLLMSRKTKRKLKLFKSIKDTDGSHILIYETQYVAQFELSVFSYFYDDSVRNDVFPNETFD